MSANPHDAAMAHLAASDPILAGIIARQGPCTLTYEPDLFAAVGQAIVSQQISTRAAATILGRVTALMPGGILTPEGVLATSEEALRAAGLSWRKVGYLRDCALRFDDGTLDPETLRDTDDETFIAALVAVKGVGRWTAEMVLLFSLGRPDILSTGDYGLRSAMQRYWDLPALATPEEMERIAAPWRPYRSIASWYLWQSLSAVPAIEGQQSATLSSERN